MTAENSQQQNVQTRGVWERLEQARRAKAAQGGYTGYDSPAFGQRSIDGEPIENPSKQQIIELIRRHHKSGKSLQHLNQPLVTQGLQVKEQMRVNQIWLWKSRSVRFEAKLRLWVFGQKRHGEQALPPFGHNPLKPTQSNLEIRDSTTLWCRGQDTGAEAAIRFTRPSPTAHLPG